MPRRAFATSAGPQRVIWPGSDVALFDGLLVCFVGADAIERSYVSQHTSGFKAAIDAALQMPIGGVACVTGPARSQLHELFSGTERTVTLYSQCLIQMSAGTDRVNAIINCHLPTGRIGYPGMGPFSATGSRPAKTDGGALFRQWRLLRGRSPRALCCASLSRAGDQDRIPLSRRSQHRPPP